ncbi:MAG: ABC transporter permease [Bryobacteraceae bacterium]
MDRFKAVEAIAEGAALHLRFEIDQPNDQPSVIGWQLFDPATGVFLREGEWSELSGTKADLRIALPSEDGPYQIQVAPVADRTRYISIEARMESGNLAISPPRVLNSGEVRRARFLRAIPRAFVCPMRSIWRNRALIGSMVKRDILARYRGSFGGTLWTLLNPLLLMGVYFFVFGVVLKTRLGGDTSGRGFLVYFLAGMLPWLAFSEAVARSPFVILEYRTFVKKVVFPLETLPVNLVISGLLTEVIGLAILVAVHGVAPAALVWLPVLLVPQLLLTVGLCWMLAATGVFVRDLGQITGFALTAWFFLTPICYVESPEMAPLFKFNPMVVLVRGYRAVFLENHAPSVRALAVLWALSIAVAVAGYGWFHRLRKSFADVI